MLRVDLKKILFVDDCADSVELFVEIFNVADFEVKGAVGGQAALMTLAEYKPDVIFLDLEMVGLDGFDVVDALKARLDFEEIVLVAVSGWSQKTWIDRAHRAGFSSYLC